MSGNDRLHYTEDEAIPGIIKRANDYYSERQLLLSRDKNPMKADLKFRVRQLQKLYYSIKDNQELIIDALMRDFHRARQETLSLELIPLLNDILLMVKKLPQWMTPKKVRDHTPMFAFGSIQVEKIARGTALVIAPSNFPLLLALTPVGNAIAGGNAVLLKPSELTENVAQIMEKIIRDADLAPGLVQVVQGGIPQTTKLIEDPRLDVIFYTGSPKVGSIIASAAAKNLVPCVLELGGKSPVFVTENLGRNKLRKALKRIFFGAFANSGQLCVRPDYVLVHESVYQEFISQARTVLNELFPQLDHETEFTHMISRAAFDKTLSKLEQTKGTPVVPRSTVVDQDNKDAECLFFPPTLVEDVQWGDALMTEENFAPVLPILKYEDLDTAIDNVLMYHDTPLAKYIFSESTQDVNHILARVRAGDCCVNETVIHVGIQQAPFGGIGQSGYGNYGGCYGFNAFTHERTVFKQPFWMDFMTSMRYLPYSKRKTQLVQMATEAKPDFDRKGKKKWSFVKLATFVSFLVLFISYMLNDCS
ncbi:hexadecenal dehydrogenase KNAG_0E02350 [Huiozyma naganishii CBS 8797]|uniref:Aldehyde dehydrogenase n=1 Tax=Huiozyma naganishii (strain ATCC MYA-139 / BCRC 22969 / CBS 8797 / KCTC 17520 / NBRC 10181 / NCYC 3082 / Yp74L-3) TaxID=1071383 RepID=J7S7U4_HUIN7|nr:hypothetical protein KNAG_0E02350 [Kazachstania naganishii CBS 8797]CCK70496.1 hypothetical protein KNAG_0E02350 [Kazachstania naganishii CBS 8797]